MTDEEAPSEGELLQYISCHRLTREGGAKLPIRSEGEEWNSFIEWKHRPCMEEVSLIYYEALLQEKGMLKVLLMTEKAPFGIIKSIIFGLHFQTIKQFGIYQPKFMIFSTVKDQIIKKLILKLTNHGTINNIYIYFKYKKILCTGDSEYFDR